MSDSVLVILDAQGGADMGRIADLIRRCISGLLPEKPAPLSEEELRATFRRRYNDFKLLITANNKALEIMTELESAYKGDRPFGMSFVRSKSAAVCVNVYRMVTRLRELAPDKYEGLLPRFEEIRSQLEDIVSYRKLPSGNDLIIPLSRLDASMVDEAGAKMANIAEIHNKLETKTPAGFVATSTACNRFLAENDLQSEIDRRIQACDKENIEELYTLSAGIRGLIVAASLPPEFEAELAAAYSDLENQVGRDVKVSLRSSALGEDIAGRAFAGQFRTELNVSRESLAPAYKEVVASKYSLQAMSYRITRGIPDQDVAMCVGCMEMVDAAAGGVAYSANPSNPDDDSVIINSAWGLPKAVVDASIETDLFIVSRQPILHIQSRAIGHKDRQFRCDPTEGVCRIEATPFDADKSSLTDDRILELAQIVIRLEDHFGRPQDIEWALDREGSFVILQSRPLPRESTIAPAIRKKPLSRPAVILADGGVTASPGVGSGKVFHAAVESDKLRFPTGSVLVTAQALPTWAPLLSRASALVTELGGVTCHLANVAREMGVPAVLGLENAVEKLPRDETVTVDADTCRMYQGVIDELLTRKPAGKSLMEGSPVHQTLGRVISHIVPLNLLDPDSPDFRPRNCVTLHDITRFVHEKSVEEMFDFGKSRPVSRHASKRLMGEVPMQWWVLDLDDGFNRPVEGKHVRIEDIASIPMLALWQGIVSVPWEGPPRVNSAGLMSVLAQAASNPALDPAVSSPYAARNYFMISKNFCSLSSRFGFHFSTVEALVGDRDQENYVSFVFKGGAADNRRKIARARLIAEILEEMGFRIRVRDDGVAARLEERPQDFMQSRLKALGYLIIHTRQLDMIMADNNSVASYRKKIRENLAIILSEDPPR